MRPLPQAMSKNMMYIAPFFALTGLYWQFGLVIYWVTTNVWTLGQQHFLFRTLPVVGSATVGASATQAASGNSGAAARNTALSRGRLPGNGLRRYQYFRQDWNCCQGGDLREDGDQAATAGTKSAATAKPAS